jgi:hypothetical protein
MVSQTDLQQFARLIGQLGHSKILGAWLGVTRRMDVGHNDTGGVELERRAEQLADADIRCVDSVG